VAFEAAYKSGGAWLDALLKYLESNRDFVADFLKTHIPEIKTVKPEATYLMWLDCRALQMTDSQLREFFIQKCKVGLSPGTVFGEQGKGFMRLNIGTTRASLEQILLLVSKAIKK
jgi:cystathionine beta-lyase